MSAAEVRVVDAFSFFNEIDLLDIRVAELGSVVSHTVITEAPATFLGFPKPLFLDQEEGLAVLRSVGQDRFTYIRVDDLPSPSDSVVPLHPLEESTAGPWKGGPGGLKTINGTH